MSAMNVVKVTLSSGKIVYLRTVKIKHTELAAQEAAPRAGGDPQVLQLLMQKALIKQIIVKVEENEMTKTPSAMELEDLDSLFEMNEYVQLLQVVRKLTGADSVGNEPTIEVVSNGGK